MRILLHVCCGPCAVYPLARLREQGHAVTGLFHNPNIHRTRVPPAHRGAAAVAEGADFPVEVDEHYGLTDFLRTVVFHEQERCPLCYDLRLERTVQAAVAGGYDAFTSTLLYSRYQNHRLLVDKCTALAERYDMLFQYEDYRTGWQQGIDDSIRLGLYRQPLRLHLQRAGAVRPAAAPTAQEIVPRTAA